MRVLSIQSHVVHGYVGNKAAVFPLQLLGFDVDVINSVQFSNHTGYDKKWEGDVLNGDQLGLLMDGLERNDLLRHTGNLLTGYIGSESFLRAVMNVLSKLKVALAVAMTSSLDQICVLMCSASNHNSDVNLSILHCFLKVLSKSITPIADSFATQCLEIMVSYMFQLNWSRFIAMMSYHWQML